VLAHNSVDRGSMARDSIELNLENAAPSPGKAGARAGTSATGNHYSSIGHQAEQNDRAQARVPVPQSSRRGRATGLRNEDDSELLLAPEDLDLESLDNEEAQFLRTQRRVPVRRSSIPKKTAGRLKIAAAIAAAVVLAGSLTGWAYAYGIHSWRFRIESSDAVEITGVRNASRAQVMEVAAADIGRNIFFVPLDERKKQLEQIPWVEQATVMRLLPNRIAVSIQERAPVAFAQIGPRISLIDAHGVVMGMPANRQTKYSFPVIRGITETEPLSSRAAAMKIYNRLIGELEAGEAAGVNYAGQLSEIDLSDPEDVKVTANDPGGTMVVHLGAQDFLGRYKLYVAHIAEWRQQFQNVQSVDLRYEGQVIVNPDNRNREIGSSGDREIRKPKASEVQSNSKGKPPRKPAKPIIHNVSKHTQQKAQR
jgi:cell division protein FtsQ